MFADAEDERQQYTMVIHNVVRKLKVDGEPVGDDGAWKVDGETVTTYHDLVELIVERLTDDATMMDWAGRAVGMGTINAFVRRLLSSQRALGHLVRADVPLRPGRHVRTAESAQVTVVDIHNLADRAQRFVVGVTLQRAFEEKEESGARRPLLFVVLDELNKYAPREGQSPIKDLLFDIAERGRSLGIILVGAQQTASEVERRVIANSALARRRPPRPGGGDAPGVRVPAGRAPRAGADRQARNHVREPARDPGAARRRVPVPRVGHPARRGARRPGGLRSRPAPAGGGGPETGPDPEPDPFAGLPGT